MAPEFVLLREARVVFRSLRFGILFSVCLFANSAKHPSPTRVFPGRAPTERNHLVGGTECWCCLVSLVWRHSSVTRLLSGLGRSRGRVPNSWDDLCQIIDFSLLVRASHEPCGCGSSPKSALERFDWFWISSLANWWESDFDCTNDRCQICFHLDFTGNWLCCSFFFRRQMSERRLPRNSPDTCDTSASANLSFD